jgi:hypothetical protein
MQADSLHEVARYVPALVPGPQGPWLGSVPDMTGLHVHLRTVPDGDIPEIPSQSSSTLHILARYEEIISSFHSGSAADTVTRTVTYTPLPISWDSKATATAAVNFLP